ncbi:MAG TPA: YbaK/EbsC family protein [Aliiroseovarius sp.]|nr:YbaK/EbsC family protein [Aliiroseovarius sp.]
MSKSITRVEKAAEAAGFEIEILRMPASTRTAAEAARACGCDVAQIVKSLIFERAEDAALVLLLVSGARQVDTGAAIFGHGLVRADPVRVRAETGFAIGGVAPIGHKVALDVWMDRHLLEHARVWAAAGAPHAVFAVAPDMLLQATGARLFDAPGLS